MGYRMDLKDADRMFAKLQEEYEIWAPKRFVGKGRYSDTDLIKYARVDRAEEIEYREKSDFPAKEVLSPITQSLFYFTEDEFIESKAGSKKLLIFVSAVWAAAAAAAALPAGSSCAPAISTHSITRKRST